MNREIGIVFNVNTTTTTRQSRGKIKFGSLENVQVEADGSHDVLVVALSTDTKTVHDRGRGAHL